ncbi:hypothetical protein GCM10017783_14920 [Deinococcus piscis]|uniref:Uncharacterized protein n=1 Tax=Deinococcus piscis TaxID=394230 RepID=A0ABQ3K4V1_9DEIO|nr:hypothetical protein [Deinococcus piscis]GHG03513.1 hypothetical protein GCM10017783_14920 [Deinococcus piscis]
MRKSLLTLFVLPLLTPAALAWSPTLDEATAQKVIDTAFQRPVADAKPTYQTVNLAVENGAFKTPGAVTQFVGPETCLSNWQAEPGNSAAGSRIQSVTASGQADSVYWQAVNAKKAWLNLKASDVLTEQARAARMADNLLRVDVKVSGAATEETRRAYQAGLKSGETMLSPVRQSYVADWKQGADGLWSGTVVYYFDATPAEGQTNLQFDPSGPVSLHFMNEQRECGYSVPLNLGSFI